MPQSPSSNPGEAEVAHAAPGARLPADAGSILLPIARAAIAAEFGIRLDVDDSVDWLAAQGASFVTLTTSGRLSGCIGSVEACRPLLEDVAGNAYAAAFLDRRFAPLTVADLDETTIEVSVLSPTTPLAFSGEADARAGLRPGVDGVVLEWEGRRATLLPQVWARVRDPGEFLSHLKLKAGLPPTFWSDTVRLSRYTVTEFHEERRHER